MKKFLVAGISTCLMTLSLNAFADKITITGDPVALERRGEVYVVPETYKSTSTYHYVTVDGRKRVCYADEQPTLVSLDPTVVRVQVEGKSLSWTCYNYDPSFFVIEEH